MIRIILIFTFVAHTISASSSSSQSWRERPFEFSLKDEERHEVFYHILSDPLANLESLWDELPLISRCAPALWIPSDEIPPSVKQDLRDFDFGLCRPLGEFHNEFAFENWCVSHFGKKTSKKFCAFQDFRYIFYREEDAQAFFKDSWFRENILRFNKADMVEKKDEYLLEFPKEIACAAWLHGMKVRKSPIKMACVVKNVVIVVYTCNIPLKEVKHLFDRAKEIATDWIASDALANEMKANADVKKMVVGLKYRRKGEGRMTPWEADLAKLEKSAEIRDALFEDSLSSQPREKSTRVLRDELFELENPKLAYQARHICANCHKSADQICGGCKRVYYCNKDCAKSHWKKHKP